MKSLVILLAILVPTILLGQDIKLEAQEWIRMDGNDRVYKGAACLIIEQGYWVLYTDSSIVRGHYTDSYELYDKLVYTSEFSKVTIYTEQGQPDIAYITWCGKVWYLEKHSRYFKNFSGQTVRDSHK